MEVSQRNVHLKYGALADSVPFRSNLLLHQKLVLLSLGIQDHFQSSVLELLDVFGPIYAKRQMAPCSVPQSCVGLLVHLSGAV